MSAPTVTKRARANTAGDTLAQSSTDAETTPQQASGGVQPSPTEEELQLLKLPQLSELLKRAAEMHPDVNAMVTDAIKEEREKRQKVVINFDHYSSSIWKSINITYRSMSGSKQYDMAWDVAGSVTSTVGMIAQKCDAMASPQTRLNGLSALRKIGKTIILSNDTLGSEVRKQFQSDPSLENAMHDIVSAMSVEERGAIMEDDSGSGSLWDRLDELENLAHGYCVFEGLKQVLDLIEGKDGDYEGSDNDDEELEGEEDELEEDEYGATGDERDIC
ncbi:hypothetical protein N7478_008938 [Penicillium angulare]|uniref:uncharacterized protein n=1 Tax=Penicillium angulare TaxID=116970 RepID=UPI00253F7B32|nr:uncharacterized protein N7478_008938 [Penicillium angulare]KAJ5273813.1 hypothetical protein N7478_008938 [Penicillium angulare]